MFDLVAQQPQLSSISRDRNELRKKIKQLEKQREQCVIAQKLSEVCAISVLLYFCNVFKLLCLPYQLNKVRGMVCVRDYI